MPSNRLTISTMLVSRLFSLVSSILLRMRGGVLRGATFLNALIANSPICVKRLAYLSVDVDLHESVLLYFSAILHEL